MRTALPTLLLVLVASRAVGQVPVAELTQGVGAIAGPGSPGALVCLTPAAVPVVNGSLDGAAVGPVCAAATWGGGRVVAFGHSGYIDKDNFSKGQTDLLLQRLAQWAAGGQPGSVAILDGDMDVWFKAKGWPVTRLSASQLTAKGLEGARLLVIGGRDLTPPQRDAIAQWVKAGGGLIAAQTGWGWQQIKAGGGDGPDMRTNHLNILLADAGIAWTDEIIDKTHADGFDVTTAAAGPTNLTDALEALIAAEGRPAPNEPAAAAAHKAALAQASATASRAIRVLPQSDATVRPRLRSLMSQHANDLAPSEKSPLRADKPFARMLLALQTDDIHAAPADQVAAHPAAAAFPGSVPPADVAPRIEKDLVIDAGVPRWHSTGLYAPPGEVVTITMPGDLASGRFSVRIGCHTDKLWHHAQWKRVPDISRSWTLGAGTNKVASAFGGLVYIDVDKTTTVEVPVTISGCVPAPLFVLGKTSPAEWNATLRHAPAPWGEIHTPSVVVSVPSSALRSLDDPTPIAQTWQEILDHAADLRAIPRTRRSPERFVPDVEISAGYMHSGYPIMTHMDAVDEMSVVSRLRAGSWGLFHELGHNHQDAMWTFEGTGEVTCNLWSLYLMEKISKKQPGRGHVATDDQVKRRERAQRHIETGANFKKWKSDPFLALEMYIQLREAFGWEPFMTVFAQYDALPQAQRPRTDMDRHDQWMTRMSREVDRNLAPFFERWGVPTTAEARQALADMPTWLPPDMPNPRAKAAPQR